MKNQSKKENAKKVIYVAMGFLSLTKNKTRGQAALEVLMTYGWAIVAAIIAISILISFSFLQPQTPDIAFLSPPFTIEDFNAQAGVNGEINLKIKNSFSEVIINDVYLTIPTGEECREAGGWTPKTLQPYQSISVNLVCTKEFSIKDQIQGKITLEYDKDDLQQVSGGELKTTVQI